MNYSQSVARRGEELAAEFLEASGYKVTARNFHVSHDEIDIICEDGKYIVFAEVKTRAQTKSNKRYGRPATAVDYSKRQKLIRAAEGYLRLCRSEKQPRIDVVEVYFPAIRAGTTADISKLAPLFIKHFRNAVHK